MYYNINIYYIYYNINITVFVVNAVKILHTREIIYIILQCFNREIFFSLKAYD